MSDAADIFLSYNREDQATARLFAKGFEQAGITVWWDITFPEPESGLVAKQHAVTGLPADFVCLYSAGCVR